MKFKLFVIIFIVFSLFITFSLCKHDDDDYDIKVKTKVKDEVDEITVNVVIKNNHHHHEHHHKELDDIQDDKANRCKGFNSINSNDDNSGSSYDNEDNEDNDENAKNHHGHHGHHGHHHDHRDICGCKFGRYGKDCRKRELEYQNSFIEWSNQFNRTYTADQFLLRFELFKDSSRFVKQYQMENPNSTMILGLTQFSDMSHDEYVNIYTSKLYDIPFNETSPSDSPCNVSINQTIVNSWNDGNQDYIQVETIITNNGPTSIRSFSFKLNNIISIWEVESLSLSSSSNSSSSSSSSNIYQLPSWISSISAGSSHRFGYIQQSNQTTPLIDQTSTCDELPTPTSTPITPSLCNANVTQTITNSWREGNQDYIQVETIITNIGESIIESYSFQLNDITSIWEVETLSNITFSLPSWKNSIQVGSSHTFGYIQKSYSINPLLSINKVCQDSSLSSNNSTTADNKPSLLKSAVSLKDWRHQRCVQRVKDQGQCGSCYTFSAIGALETAYCLKHNHNLPDLSEQHLVDCGGRGCGGGWMQDMFTYLKNNGGAITQADYPYTGKVGTCQNGSKHKAVLVQSHKMIQRGDENALMQALSLVGTISIAYNAGTQAHAYYRGGILDVPNCGNNPTHAVLLVGYGSENGKDYWLIKNSWGFGWGEQGYFRMARGKNMCGIADWASYPIVA